MLRSQAPRIPALVCLDRALAEGWPRAGSAVCGQGRAGSERDGVCDCQREGATSTKSGKLAPHPGGLSRGGGLRGVRRVRCEDAAGSGKGHLAAACHGPPGVSHTCCLPGSSHQPVHLVSPACRGQESKAQRGQPVAEAMQALSPQGTSPRSWQPPWPAPPAPQDWRHGLCLPRGVLEGTSRSGRAVTPCLGHIPCGSQSRNILFIMCQFLPLMDLRASWLPPISL